MLQVVEMLPASLELALYPLRMGFEFVALAVVEQSLELAAGGLEFANAVVEVQASEPAVVVMRSVLLLGPGIA